MSLGASAEDVSGEGVVVDLAGAEGCSLGCKNGKVNKWLVLGGGDAELIYVATVVGRPGPNFKASSRPQFASKLCHPGAWSGDQRPNRKTSAEQCATEPPQLGPFQHVWE